MGGRGREARAAVAQGTVASTPALRPFSVSVGEDA